MESEGRFKQYFQSFICGFLSCGILIMAALLVLQHTGKLDLSGAVLYGNSSLRKEIQKKSTLIEQFIDKYYLDRIDDEYMANSVYKGLVAGLNDEYAAYYTKEEYKTITEKTSGTYYGIGAYVTTNTETGAITIVKPIKGGPADQAGLQAEDIIYAVDGTEVTGKDLSEVLALIKGKVGTQVKLKVLRKGEKDYLEIPITRAEIKDETVESRMLADNIGYIQVTAFEEVTVQQFQSALKELQQADMKALVIDLRDNGGGLLTTAVEMLDLMLPEGLVVYTEDKKGVAEKYYAEDADEIKIPVAILVNGNSASASEVFSGAMQDEGKAKLVGTKTFGKGIVQTIFDLQDGSALKMTTSKYFTPKGRNIHGSGLEPDIKVELDKETLQKSDSKGNLQPDNQMQKAIEYLQQEIA